VELIHKEDSCHSMCLGKQEVVT